MKEKKLEIILKAAELFHKSGYKGVGIKKILDELNIPKGSFYYYFKSKDELALEIINIYINDTKNIISSVEKSLDGILEFFNVLINRFYKMDLRGGCPVGNLIIELADEKEIFRLKLLEWFNILNEWIYIILQENNIKEPEKISKFLISYFEGTLMIAKLTKDSNILKEFLEILKEYLKK
ncbi:MAG: TetR/AcrR family transcriptional regulator, transcriptional repressor for nem operon [Fusobacteriaceae bacterium]|jgi:TetR/AcrR family transcriptional repressor of nem operon|nr:TetR family transcriptional regulator [Fusobacteriales bacterium]MDN5303677.1 TetR/AcrR family transcriptional regulator, transcriptional repressor for nem operon [Fusobacteriaceae bacterium]